MFQFEVTKRVKSLLYLKLLKKKIAYICTGTDWTSVGCVFVNNLAPLQGQLLVPTHFCLGYGGTNIGSSIQLLFGVSSKECLHAMSSLRGYMVVWLHAW